MPTSPCVCIRRCGASLSAEPGLAKGYSARIELPLLPVLARMERLGTTIEPCAVAISRAARSKLRLQELEKQATSWPGGFNLSSPKQLGKSSSPSWGCRSSKRPPGAPSTAEEVLAELAETYELPQLLMEHRGLAKLKSTYTDKLPLMIKPQTGRVHTSYHQAVAATGRLSSTDPNLQNIPVRNEQGAAFGRPSFRAGYKLVAADYSQIELRIMAHLSGDKGLLTAFAEGRTSTRRPPPRCSGVALDAVTSDMRRSAKAINFGLIYGMCLRPGQAAGIVAPKRRSTWISTSSATRGAGVHGAHPPAGGGPGLCRNLFGRRLYLPDIKSRNAGLRKAAERAAINAPCRARLPTSSSGRDQRGWLDPGALKTSRSAC